MDSISSDSVLNDDDDEFGMESGGWCCFMNNLPIIYLQMWLNEKPDLTQFVSWQIPQETQLDTSNAVASKKQRASDSRSVSRRHKKSTNEAVAEAIVGYMKVKEATTLHPSNMTEALGVMLKTFMHAQSTIEKIELLEKQISVVTKRVEQSKSKEKRQC
jgi:hypothetical protein